MNPLDGSFPKKYRLSSKIEIDNLFKKGKVFISYPFKIHYYIESSKSNNLSFLICVSKSKLRSAVKRNYIKRITRESLRIKKNIILDNLEEKKLQLRLAFVYIPNTVLGFNEVNTSVNKVFVKINDILEKLNVNNSET